MEPTARTKLHILITDAGSYLGSSIAKALLSQGHVVYGIGTKNPPDDILAIANFTFAQIDLAQPVPPQFPEFDVILNITNELPQTGTFNQASSLPPQALNLINIAKKAKTKVFFLAPINSNTQIFEHLGQDQKLRENLKLFLLGDIYGPEMSFQKSKDYFSNDNNLANLIIQAAQSDKVILEKEGMETIYPTYILDATDAIRKFIEIKDHKNIRFIVSQPATRTLQAAYEIQSVAREVLSKDLGLFFSGEKQQVKQMPEPIVRTSDLGFSPKFNLTHGLKLTFESLKQRDLITFQIKDPTPNQEQSYQSQAIEQKKQTLKNSLSKKTLRIPKVKNKVALKKILAVLVLIFVLTVAKTGFDIFLGIRNISLAKDELTTGNFQNAQAKANSASRSFNAAYNKAVILTYPVKLIKNKTVFPAEILLASQKGAQSLAAFIHGTQIYTRDIKSIIDKNTQENNSDYDTPSADYENAYSLSAEALELFKNSPVKFPKNKIETAQTSLESLMSISRSALELVNFTNDFVNQQGKKTYLVLLENNTELRPGGGFIGNYALVKFNGGKFQDVSVDDIYNIDGQLQEKITPPPQLTEKLGTKQLYLRDSNWSTDFTLNAATAKDFFKKETGQDVNGVIAVDLTYIQWLLDKIGPVKLSDYNETITAQNLFERGEYHSEVGFFPGSTQKKDFFATLTGSLFQNITAKLTSTSTKENSAPWAGIILATKDALQQDHLMLTFDDPNLASFVKSKGWDHPLPPVLFDPADDSKGTRDFVALSEANLGANKANRHIERNIDYEMTIGKDADLVGKLKITYKNNSQAETWPAGKYINYLRVYTPFASSLFAIQNGDDTDLKNVEVTIQNNMTVFATYVEVPIKSTKTITFTYRIPKNIKLEQTPTYDFYIQKQPGTDKDSFTFHYNLPSYLQVKSINKDDTYQGKQNVHIDSDLSIDRYFVIDLESR